jgi:hypothetical protein
MEEKDVDLWWDVVEDIVQKDITKRILGRFVRSMKGMKGCTNTRFF